jgi:glycerol-3-phosphate acyltransferase PlsX
MPKGITIAVDGMGGDHAPEIVLDGIELAAGAHPGVRFAVHGPAARLETLLGARPRARKACVVRPADGVVAMDVKPSQAMRQGRGSSMWNAISDVETGEAQAVVSAGNTGALMAIAMLRLRMTPGIARPALVAAWPTLQGYAAVLDVGATVEADAAQLVDYCIMGEAFYRAIYGKARPTVGLLNVGSEDQKGHEEIRAAAKLLRESGVDLAFHGFVEGDDISKGAVDVVVTDGFSGNIALKTAEGTARLVSTFLKDALTSGPFAMLGAAIAQRALRQLKDRMDPRTVNGGVFLGLNGLVVKSHGGTDGPGFAAALNVAVRMAESRFREEVAASLARMARAAPEPAPAAGAS